MKRIDSFGVNNINIERAADIHPTPKTAAIMETIDAFNYFVWDVRTVCL